MQQVVVFYFEFFHLNFASSKVPIGTARTPAPFYRFSSRLGNSVQSRSLIHLSTKQYENAQHFRRKNSVTQKLEQLKRKHMKSGII